MMILYKEGIPVIIVESERPEQLSVIAHEVAEKIIAVFNLPEEIDGERNGCTLHRARNAGPHRGARLSDAVLGTRRCVPAVGHDAVTDRPGNGVPKILVLSLPMARPGDNGSSHNSTGP